MFMKFLNQNKFLVTCSWRNKAQVIVYNIINSSIVLSIQVNDFAIDILTIHNFALVKKVNLSK